MYSDIYENIKHLLKDLKPVIAIMALISSLSEWTFWDHLVCYLRQDGGPGALDEGLAGKAAETDGPDLSQARGGWEVLCASPNIFTRFLSLATKGPDTPRE